MISKTIGFFGVHYFQTNPFCSFEVEYALRRWRESNPGLPGFDMFGSSDRPWARIDVALGWARPVTGLTLLTW
jgi:hypothetical protein